jgi:outer membrane protein assembly factor BamB
MTPPSDDAGKPTRKTAKKATARRTPDESTSGAPPKKATRKVAKPAEESRSGAASAPAPAGPRPCPFCAEEIPGDATVCPECGENVTPAPKKRMTGGTGRRTGATSRVRAPRDGSDESGISRGGKPKKKSNTAVVVLIPTVVILIAGVIWFATRGKGDPVPTDSDSVAESESPSATPKKTPKATPSDSPEDSEVPPFQRSPRETPAESVSETPAVGPTTEGGAVAAVGMKFASGPAQTVSLAAGEIALVDPRSGKVSTRFRLPEGFRAESGAAFVSGARVFVRATDGNYTHLFAFDRATGQIAYKGMPWEIIVNAFAVDSANGVLITGTDSDFNDATVFIDRDSGNVKWNQSAMPKPPNAAELRERRLVVSAGKLFIVDKGAILAVDCATGRASWIAQKPPTREFHFTALGDGIVIAYHEPIADAPGVIAYHDKDNAQAPKWKQTFRCPRPMGTAWGSLFSPPGWARSGQMDRHFAVNGDLLCYSSGLFLQVVNWKTGALADGMNGDGLSPQVPGPGGTGFPLPWKNGFCWQQWNTNEQGNEAEQSHHGFVYPPGPKGGTPYDDSGKQVSGKGAMPCFPCVVQRGNGDLVMFDRRYVHVFDPKSGSKTATIDITKGEPSREQAASASIWLADDNTVVVLSGNDMIAVDLSVKTATFRMTVDWATAGADAWGGAVLVWAKK